MVIDSDAERIEKERERADSRERKKYLSDIREVIATPAGRRLVWKLLGYCDRISAHQSGSWTYFREGERNVSLQLKADIIDAHPDLYIDMLKDSIKKEREVKDDDINN